MSLNLIFLVGLPGSGKTTLAKSNFTDYYLIDDPREAPKINNDINTIIADCHLCYLETFKQVITLYPEASYIFFENNLKKCYQNIIKRKDNRKISYEFMQSLSLEYNKVLNNLGNINYIFHKVYGT